MTCILGWMYDDSAYLVADSAITFSEPDPQDVDLATQAAETSFGEMIVASDERVIREAALKIVHLDKLAVAYAGNVPTAHSVIEQLNACLSFGLSPRDALDSALNTIGPLKKRICLIVAVPGLPKPSLLGFDSADGQGVYEVPKQTLIHFGTMPKGYTDLSAHFLGFFEPPAGQDPQPDRSLVRQMAIVQSYGMHDRLLRKGVGGCFVGLSVQRDEIRWQPDLLYLLHTDLAQFRFVSSIVRDRVHVVRSNVLRRCSYFGVEVNGGLSDQWKDQWYDSAHDFPREGRFDFAVLLNRAARNVTVVEMLGHRDSEYFRLYATAGERPEEEFRLHTEMSPNVQTAMLTRPPNLGDIQANFAWFPFSPPVVSSRGADSPEDEVVGGA